MLPGCKPAFTFPPLFKLLYTFSRPQSPRQTPLRWWSRSRWCGWGWRFWCGNARRSAVSPSGVLTPPLPPSSSAWGSHLRTHSRVHVCVDVDRLCSSQAGYLLTVGCWFHWLWVGFRTRICDCCQQMLQRSWRNAGADDYLWFLITVQGSSRSNGAPACSHPSIRPQSPWVRRSGGAWAHHVP